MRKEHGKVYVKRSQCDCSMSFKLGVVGEVERGELSLTDAARKYGIQGDGTILRANNLLIKPKRSYRTTTNSKHRQ